MYINGNNTMTIIHMNVTCAEEMHEIAAIETEVKIRSYFKKLREEKKENDNSN